MIDREGSMGENQLAETEESHERAMAEHTTQHDVYGKLHNLSEEHDRLVGWTQILQTHLTELETAESNILNVLNSQKATSAEHGVHDVATFVADKDNFDTDEAKAYFNKITDISRDLKRLEQIIPIDHGLHPREAAGIVIDNFARRQEEVARRRSELEQNKPMNQAELTFLSSYQDRHRTTLNLYEGNASVYLTHSDFMIPVTTEDFTVGQQAGNERSQELIYERYKQPLEESIDRNNLSPQKHEAALTLLRTKLESSWAGAELQQFKSTHQELQGLLRKKHEATDIHEALKKFKELRAEMTDLFQHQTAALVKLQLVEGRLAFGFQMDDPQLGQQLDEARNKTISAEQGLTSHESKKPWWRGIRKGIGLGDPWGDKQTELTAEVENLKKTLSSVAETKKTVWEERANLHHLFQEKLGYSLEQVMTQALTATKLQIGSYPLGDLVALIDARANETVHDLTTFPSHDSQTLEEYERLTQTIEQKKTAQENAERAYWKTANVGQR